MNGYVPKIILPHIETVAVSYENSAEVKRQEARIIIWDGKRILSDGIMRFYSIRANFRS